jgi:hypothetical protein
MSEDDMRERQKRIVRMADAVASATQTVVKEK